MRDALLAALLFGAACSGVPSRHPEFVPANLKAVYVFTFVADSSGGPAAARMTREVQRLLAAQKKVFPVEYLGMADGLIEGRIRRIFIEPVTTAAAGRIDKGRYCLEVEFSFRDLVNKTWLLEKKIMTTVRDVRLQSAARSDLTLVLEEMVDEVAGWIVDYALSGKPPRYNPLFGYEKLPDSDASDGILVGRPRKNYDLNNDGIDDRLQGLTNSSSR